MQGSPTVCIGSCGIGTVGEQDADETFVMGR
ncbi:hypothetical protein SAMN05421854_104125 [Amycolatopsis rubida]|uniref:Uncharacterized protein n=1 Tax=Amycolatopsis rubida TaxID=112413 RepID=A0A1I5MS57_9PSEU|nr:hypothetical protein SAMN05421854_104125 [Amycolatopsis rubida]